jgi:hypothetical protein
MEIVKDTKTGLYKVTAAPLLVYGRENLAVKGSERKTIETGESHSRHEYLCFYSVSVFFCAHVAVLRQADAPSKESCRLCTGLRN